MARKVNIILTDDLDENVTADRTISFALEGVQYEIDLSDKNAAAFEKAVAKFRDAARKVGKTARVRDISSARGAARTSNDRERTRQIREWAKANGIDVSERGRISGEVVEKYEAANA